MSTLDAHVHFWDPRRLDYPWLEGIAGLDAPHLPADLPAGHPGRIVFVQADCLPTQSLDEARWVAQLATEHPDIVGVVAAADLRSPGLEAHLDALSGIGLVVGVRHLLQGEPGERLGDPALARGLATLADRGLPFDACIGHRQLPALIELVWRTPNLRVVLDHLGKPPVDEGLNSDAAQSWSAGIRRLASLPETFVKLSGLPPESRDRAAYGAHAADFVAEAVDAFGPARAMIGSDWPVSAVLGAAESPQRWRERVRDALTLDAHEWRQVSARTGERFYGIPGD